MTISRNKLVAIAIAAVVVAGLVFLVAKLALDPMRAPIPDKTVPITAIQPKLDRLTRMDRQLVIGYLLLQRGEAGSLSTQGIPLTAKNFREAIAVQKGLLEAKHVSPEWPLLRALEAQALRPLRAAVPIELAARKQSTMRELVLSKGDSALVASGGTPDEPRTVMIYRIHNPGSVAIKHLTGYIQPRVASNDWADTAHGVSACHVDLANIAPGASAQVICAQADLSAIGDASKTPDDRLIIDWRPGMVEYADGNTLSYDINAITNTLLWNHYTIDADIR